MDTSVVISLILGTASIISSICFGLIPGIRKNKIEKLKKKSMTLAQDLDFFYTIEQSLLTQLSEATGKNYFTLQRDTRKKVKNMKNRTLSNYSKPSGLAHELEED